jgi:hypothetical protein
MKTSSIRFAVVAVVVMASYVQGATLATPLVINNGTDFPLCVATNIGTKNATVTVEFKDGTGAVQTPIAASCGTVPVTLTPGRYCFNRYATGADGYCVVSAKGKVRAALEVYDSGFLVKTLIGATK